jgi:hypothetical protein
METGTRVRVISDPAFSGMEGVITHVSPGQGSLRITVKLDEDEEEWPFDENELEVIK